MGQAWKNLVGVEDQPPIWHNDLRNGQVDQHVPETGSYILERGAVYDGTTVASTSCSDPDLGWAVWPGISTRG